MSNDPLSPIAPARVRVLVLPAGRIKKQRFVTFLDRLHQHDSVRLGDISPDGRSSKTIFSPLAFPNGSLLYNFSTSMAPPSHTQLAPFDLFREPMMVLGIADALEYESSPKDELQEVADKLAEQFPKILVSQLLVMDCTAEQQESWSLDSAICVPPSHTTKTTTMNTIMCDISAKLLSEMGTYATAVQALPSVQSPGAAARPSDSRPHLDRSLSLASRPESPAGPSAVLSPSDTHPSRGPPTNFDEMGAHTRSDSGKMANRDRMSVQAFGSTSAQEKAKNKGKARVGIVVGNLYMLAGRWNDAWRELVENTNKARTATDYLWYAKGLESIVVCMLLLIWSGFDFPIPAICNSGPDRSSSLISSAITRDGVPPIGQQEPAAAKQAASRASRLLPDLVPMIISIYERTNTLAGEPMSPVAYSETVLRMSKLLAFLQNAGGELDSNVLQKIASTSSRSLYQPKVNAGFSGGISKHAIADMALRAYPPPSAGVPLADTIAIQSGIVSILSMLGLERKKAVIVKEMITLLVPALVQARKVGAAEMGIHPAASLSAAFGPGIPSAATNDEQVGLGNLLRDLHATYGARDRNHLDLKKGASDAGQENAVDVLINATIALTTQSAGTKSFGSINLKIDILRACIDFCEALPDLPGVVHFSALLLRVVGPQGTMTAHEQNRRVTLVTEEQLRLISNMSRTINAANKIGLPDVRALYWDDFLVRDVQWIDDTNNEKLRERFFIFMSKRIDLATHIRGLEVQGCSNLCIYASTITPELRLHCLELAAKNTKHLWNIHKNYNMPSSRLHLNFGYARPFGLLGLLYELSGDDLHTCEDARLYVFHNMNIQIFPRDRSASLQSLHNSIAYQQAQLDKYLQLKLKDGHKRLSGSRALEVERETRSYVAEFKKSKGIKALVELHTAIIHQTFDLWNALEEQDRADGNVDSAGSKTTME
ncbi:hypercellular protein-like protein HypA [Aureobasidium pullulans]|nr:hypercellular protein-like protein HypA [Aureobasidium pullulans]